MAVGESLIRTREFLVTLHPPSAECPLWAGSRAVVWEMEPAHHTLSPAVATAGRLSAHPLLFLSRFREQNP